MYWPKSVMTRFGQLEMFQNKIKCISAEKCQCPLHGR